MTKTTGHESDERRTLADMIAGIQSVLADARVEPAPTRRAAILGCRTEIEEARRKGLTWAQIAQLLEKAGIAVSADSLRTYVSRTATKEKAVSVPSGQATAQLQRPLPSSPPASPHERKLAT